MNGPQLGEFDRRVLVREWQDVPTPGAGISQSFDNVQRAWGRLEPVGAALFYGTAQVEAGVTHRFATWRTSKLNERTVTGAHVVESEGMRYRVRRATAMDQERMFLLLDLEELGAING